MERDDKLIQLQIYTLRLPHILNSDSPRAINGVIAPYQSHQSVKFLSKSAC